MVDDRIHYRRGGGRGLDLPPPKIVVELFTPHSVIAGTLRLAFNRLTDHLNFGPPIVTLQRTSVTRLGQVKPVEGQSTAHIRRDVIILAIDRPAPRYLASHPDLYEAKEAVRVTADLGHFVISGTIHLQRGHELADWLVEGPLFVPLTMVTIRGGGAIVEEPFAVINRSMLHAILSDNRAP